MRTVEKPRTFACYLVAFGLALVVPLALYATAITIQFALSQQSQLDLQADDITSDVIASINQEIVGQTKALEALATSPALWSDNPRGTILPDKEAFLGNEEV